MPLPEYTDPSLDDVNRPAPDFDVREYARTAVGTLREGLDTSSYETSPLPQPVLRVLALLQAVERSTMQHMRTVLVTPTHKDARITAFLTTWAFEKFWVADALSAILAAHPPLPQARRTNPVVRFVREVRERLAPITESLVGNNVGTPMLAVHMATGAIDGWVTQAAYARAGELAGNAELSTTLERVIGIKGRHLSFFEPQAEYRLGASQYARTLARRRLKRLVWPIGAGELPEGDRAFFFDHVFRGAPGLAEGIDTAIDGLPGLAGLGLVARAAGTRSTS